MEVSAGILLVQDLVQGDASERRVLVIRMKKEGYEIPKGHLEPGEDAESAALRELREETGLTSGVVMGLEIAKLEYFFHRAGALVAKRAHYFVARGFDGQPIEFGRLPEGTKELRWVTSADLADLSLVNEDLRTLIARALGAEG